MTNFTPGELTDQLSQTWASVADVCSTLTAAEWRAPTDCPGWDVRAQVAHLIGTESMLAGRPPPPFDGPYGDHVHNDMAKFNEAGIASFAGVSDGDLLAAFSAITAERLAALSSLDPEAWDVVGPTPIGPAPYERFMEIRVFDCWAHEQDIRWATDRPGHQSGPAVERCVDEVVGALGFLVGKRARAPEGSHVRFSVAGLPTAAGSPADPAVSPGEAAPIPAPPQDVDVVVDGRARVVPSGSAGTPTVTVHTDPVTLVRLGCGRITGPACLADGTVTLSGDPELGQRVVGNLAFTI
ncbi:MAG: maleylpyruvate isomerase family mycothiol-dependent enzyme [Actinomycetota bacterium]|nr:maleylpyruvate isomerase family mycothiol-dependent enzyme [Actinomycetota bacterium]